MGRATTSAEAQRAKAEAKPIVTIATCDGFRKGAQPIYELIESASSCHGCTDQWPDAAPDGEASTKTIGKSCCGGCRPSAIAFVGRS